MASQTFLYTSLPYLLVVLLCSFIVAVQECSQLALKHFKYPFILRYINSIEQLLLVLIIPIWRWWKRYHISKSHMKRKANYNNRAINYKSSRNSRKRDYKINIIKPDIDIDDKHFYWFIFYTFLGSLTTSSAGMVLNIGLNHITVPTAVALSTFRTVFILILSVMFLLYPLKLWSICAVIVSCLGVLLYVMEINNNDTNDGDHHDTIYGISCCLIAQLLFGINDIICKKAANYCYDKNKIIMGNILYTIYTSSFALPLFIWVFWYPQNIININISLDSGTYIWILMTGICLIGVHVIGYITITLKSPIWTAMGFLLATPMSFIVDIIIHNYKPSYLCVLGGMLLLLGFLMLEVFRPSQILCPFCDKILVNQGEDVEDWDMDEGSTDFERKCKLSDSLSDEYGYKYKKDNVNEVRNNQNNNSNNKKYNSRNSKSSDDIEPMLSALLQSGGTYTSTMPSDVGNNYTTEDIAEISFDINENDNDNDHISQ
eukprot:167210_1